MRAELDNLKATLATAEAATRTTTRATPTGGSGSNKDDTLDATILRINTKNYVDINALLAVVRKLCTACDIPENGYELRGGSQATRFTLVFNGEVRAAERNARNVHASLRRSDNKWDKVYVDRPNGRGNEEVHISPDKEKWKVRGEQATKLLRDIIADEHSNNTFVAIKREFTITEDWQKVATIDTRTDDAAGIKINWSDAKCDTLKLDKPKLEKLFLDRWRSRGSRG